MFCVPPVRDDRSIVQDANAKQHMITTKRHINFFIVCLLYIYITKNKLLFVGRLTTYIMGGSFYNGSAALIGNVKLFVGSTAGVAGKVSVIVGMLCVVTLYRAVHTGSCVPVMSFVCCPGRSIEGVLVSVVVCTNVTFAVVVTVDVCALFDSVNVASAAGNLPVFVSVVCPLVGVSANLIGTLITVAVLVFVNVSCNTVEYLVVTVGIVPVIFGIVVPVGLFGVVAELIFTCVTNTVVITVVVKRYVDLLCAVTAGSCVPVLGLGGYPR